MKKNNWLAAGLAVLLILALAACNVNTVLPTDEPTTDAEWYARNVQSQQMGELSEQVHSLLFGGQKGFAAPNELTADGMAVYAARFGDNVAQYAQGDGSFVLPVSYIQSTLDALLADAVFVPSDVTLGTYNSGDDTVSIIPPTLDDTWQSSYNGIEIVDNADNVIKVFGNIKVDGELTSTTVMTLKVLSQNESRVQAYAVTTIAESYLETASDAQIKAYVDDLLNVVDPTQPLAAFESISADAVLRFFTQRANMSNYQPKKDGPFFIPLFDIRGVAEKFFNNAFDPETLTIATFETANNGRVTFTELPEVSPVQVSVVEKKPTAIAEITLTLKWSLTQESGAAVAQYGLLTLQVVSETDLLYLSYVPIAAPDGDEPVDVPTEQP